MKKQRSGVHPLDEVEDEVEIHVASYFHKGLRRRIYAWQYGKKCFVFRVRARRGPAPASRD